LFVAFPPSADFDTLSSVRFDTHHKKAAAAFTATALM
jgi:hypothetical protein